MARWLLGRLLLDHAPPGHIGRVAQSPVVVRCLGGTNDGHPEKASDRRELYHPCSLMLARLHAAFMWPPFWWKS